MKLIPTREAVGHVLCHDMTQIIKGSYKDARFRKGHVVTEEDIPVLLSMGKENLYVWEMVPGMVHENDAAERLRAICQGAHMTPSAVKEGKIELKADCDGLFLVDVDRLDRINLLDDIMIATRHSGTAVRAGDKLCGTRVIPLVIEEEKLREGESDTALWRAPMPEALPDGMLAVAQVEGWRGELCHVAVTDAEGRFGVYKIYDPSWHNWSGLEMALRGEQISDFPLCNKSFNLSYCGHDL